MKKFGIAACLAAVCVGLILIPLEIHLSSPDRRIERAYARRAQLPVIRADTIRIHPILAPWDMAYGHRTFRTPRGDLLPLTGLSRRMTGLCASDGSELVYESDEHGFRSSSGAVHSDIAIIGDSFAAGYCVPFSESIAGRLSAPFENVSDLGVTGAGPLTELAVLREYASSMKPQLIVWLYFEGNDLEGIEAERTGFLARYLSPDFSQDLAQRQEEIDSVQLTRLDSLARSFLPDGAEWLKRILKLREIRARLGISFRGKETTLAQPAPGIDREIPNLERILSMARDETATWGGRILFVYLPERGRFDAADSSDATQHVRIHDRVLEVPRSLGIPVIDLAAAFAAERDPLSLWDSGKFHYNARGYALVADSITAWIAQKSSPSRMRRSTRAQPPREYRIPIRISASQISRPWRHSLPMLIRGHEK